MCCNMFCKMLFTALALLISLPGRSAEDFAGLFEYEENNYFFFDRQGNAVSAQDTAPATLPRTAGTMSMKISEQGEYIIRCGDFSYRGEPGDYVFPLHEDEDFLYLLTEKDFDCKKILAWHRKLHTGELFFPQKNQEAMGIIFYGRLHGIQYAGDAFSCEFFTDSFKHMDQKLRNYYQTDSMLWNGKSPDGVHWILQIFFKNKPSLFVLCNTDKGTWQELSKKIQYRSEPSQTKEIFTFIAGDGEKISGVLSFPPARFGRHNLPLIVFPHGGPQTRSMPVFNPKVEQLTSNGFLVFQPNYRGSTGQDKFFRQSGWKPQGIRRGLADIADGTAELIRQGIADSRKVAIFGGSWGGYCALASLMLYPDLYKAGISFFGASDLPAMQKTSPADSGANSALDKLQYGNTDDPEVAAELKAISPYFHTDKIKSPVLMYHFKGDTVIDFEQSDKFYRKMKQHGKNIHFITGTGKHGFENGRAESAAYENIIRFVNAVFQSGKDGERFR